MTATRLAIAHKKKTRGRSSNPLNLTWLAQVAVRLPAELSGAGDMAVSVTVHGVESNKAMLRVN